MDGYCGFNREQRGVVECEVALWFECKIDSGSAGEAENRDACRGYQIVHFVDNGRDADGMWLRTLGRRVLVVDDDVVLHREFSVRTWYP